MQQGPPAFSSFRERLAQAQQATHCSAAGSSVVKGRALSPPAEMQAGMQGCPAGLQAACNNPQRT